MKNLYLLLPPALIEDPEKDRELVPVILAAYQALWHPAFLAEAESPPSFRELSNLPQGEDLVLVVPEKFLESASEITQKDLSELKATLLIAKSEHTGLTGPGRLLESLDLPTTDPELLLDFFAFGYAHLALEILFEKMGHEKCTDDWSLMSELRNGAERYLDGDVSAAREGLQSAFDVLLTARHTVYPATISWIDLAFISPRATALDLEHRLRWAAPLNLLLTGSEVDRLARENEKLLERLRDAVGGGSIEVLGGTYDDRPISILPFESRCWQLDRSADAYEKHLGREVDGYGSRSMALVSDLPQQLAKFQYRYALHAGFDAGKFPHFREPKHRWTSPDGSVIDVLARDALDGSAENDAFAVVAELAKTITHDRSATMVLAHWLSPTASWLGWILRMNEYEEVLGKFQVFSDYFLDSSSPDRPTRTRVEEYSSQTLRTAVAHKDPNPISRWVDFHHLRGRLDAARVLIALHQIATSESPERFDEAELAVETGEPDATQQVQEIERQGSELLTRLLLKDAPSCPGYLILNPCNFPRRACLQLEEIPPDLPIETPLRGLQVGPEKSAVVLDVPGWGYAWIPRTTIPTSSLQSPASSLLSAVGSRQSGSRQFRPMAKGRKLHNEFLEVEIDKRTGGIRGIWEPRSGYSRIGQQLVHSAGGRTVCGKIEATSIGPAYGEIVSRGEIRTKDNKKLIAKFEQRTRLWIERPHLDLSIELDLLEPITGDPTKNYIACRWAWPDDKALVLPANGFVMQVHRDTEWEAPQLIEIRERKLVTDILPNGLPFHHRIGYRMVDTLLLAEGETRRKFELIIALDLAHPWPAVQETFWPVTVAKVQQGPPKKGRTGWLAHLDAPNILCTRMIPITGDGSGVGLRLVETEGKKTNTELKFCRDPESDRLTNCRGQLIRDSNTSGEQISLDFSAHELHQLEVMFQTKSP